MSLMVLGLVSGLCKTSKKAESSIQEGLDSFTSPLYVYARDIRIQVYENRVGGNDQLSIVSRLLFLASSEPKG